MTQLCELASPLYFICMLVVGVVLWLLVRSSLLARSAPGAFVGHFAHAGLFVPRASLWAVSRAALHTQWTYVLHYELRQQLKVDRCWRFGDDDACAIR